jgi:thymidylate synthase
MTHTYPTATIALPNLLEMLNYAPQQNSRNGLTREVLGTQVKITQPWHRAVLTPGRKASLPAQIVETAWVLSGNDDISVILPYLPRAKDFSDDGTTWRGGYGPRIRRWGSLESIDQLDYVIRLLKSDPDTRRAVIQIYDPTIDSHTGFKDTPCNNWLHFIARDGLLHLHVATRSNDVMWGWSGINAFEWSVLLEVVAAYTGLKMGHIVFNISSLHLYERHFNKAQSIVEKSNYEREYGKTVDFQKSWPTTRFHPVGDLDSLLKQFFEREARIRLKGDTSGIYVFPEPMLRGWLHVLAYHWTRDQSYLENVDMELRLAALQSPAPACNPIADDFANYVCKLHDEKHAAYGNSWKRRGEMLSILPNIARKVDRLGGGETSDETSTDTAIDLLVYLAKYRWWLFDHAAATAPLSIDGYELTDLSDGTKPTNDLIRSLKPHEDAAGNEVEWLKSQFDNLISAVENGGRRSVSSYVDDMLRVANNLARQLWQKDQDSKSHAERNATRRWNPEPEVDDDDSN